MTARNDTSTLKACRIIAYGLAHRSKEHISYLRSEGAREPSGAAAYWLCIYKKIMEFFIFAFACDDWINVL